MTHNKNILLALLSLLLAGALSNPTLAASKKKIIKPVASAPTPVAQPLEDKPLPIEEPVVPHVVNPCSHFAECLSSILRNAGQLDQSHTYEALHKIENFPTVPLKGSFIKDQPGTVSEEIAKGNLAAAMVLLRNQRLSVPENMNFYSELGRLEMQTGDTVQAEQDLELALQRYASNGLKWRELAAAYLANGKQQQAAQALFYGYIFQRTKDVLADYQASQNQAAFVQALQLINEYEEQLTVAFKNASSEEIKQQASKSPIPFGELKRAGFRCDKPGYPRSAQRAGQEGSNVIGLLLDRNGTVIYVWLHKSADSRELDRAALAWGRVCYGPDISQYGNFKTRVIAAFPMVWKLE